MSQSHKRFFMSTRGKSKKRISQIKEIAVFYHEIYSMRKYPIPHNSRLLLTSNMTLHLSSAIFCLRMSHRAFPFPYINSSQIKHNSLIVKVKASSHVIWFMKMLLFRKSRNKFASTWTKIYICHKPTLHCLWREHYNIKFTNKLSSLCNNSLNKLFKNPSKSTRIGEITVEN